jgi:hypothetical protein
MLLFLCRHVVHGSCVLGDQLPIQPDVDLIDVGVEASSGRSMSGKIALFVYLFAFVVSNPLIFYGGT